MRREIVLPSIRDLRCRRTGLGARQRLAHSQIAFPPVTYSLLVTLFRRQSVGGTKGLRLCAGPFRLRGCY